MVTRLPVWPSPIGAVLRSERLKPKPRGTPVELHSNGPIGSIYPAESTNPPANPIQRAAHLGLQISKVRGSVWVRDKYGINSMKFAVRDRDHRELYILCTTNEDRAVQLALMLHKDPASFELKRCS